MKTRDREAWRKRYDEKSVKGLPLPSLLLELMKTGRWRTPPDEVVFSAIPCLKEPIRFLTSVEQIAFESQDNLADSERFELLFHEYRGSSAGYKFLPWLDVEKSLFIAVNHNIGDDLEIALDYRTGTDEPSVLVSDWWAGDNRCRWREVTKSFSELVALLKL